MMRCLRLAAPCHFALSFFFFGVASADQNNAGTTSHDAHVHGEWELFAALDESRLTVTVSGPLIDALGFERAPPDDTEKAQTENVARALSDAANVISSPAPARCSDFRAQKRRDSSIAPRRSVAILRERREFVNGGRIW